MSTDGNEVTAEVEIVISEKRSSDGGNGGNENVKVAMGLIAMVAMLVTVVATKMMTMQ